MGASDPNFTAVKIPTSDPPQVRVINAWGTVLLNLIGVVVELSVIGCATYMLMLGKIDSALWAACMGAPLIGPGIGKATGKLPKGTTAMLLGASPMVAEAVRRSGIHLLSLAIAVSIALGGCGALGSLVKDSADVIQQVTHYVDLIEAQARSASEAGVIPKDIADRITAAREAIAAIDDAAQDGPAAYAAAVQLFQNVYDQLLKVSAPVGVRAVPRDRRIVAASRDGVQVPTPEELGDSLREPL